MSPCFFPHFLSPFCASKLFNYLVNHEHHFSNVILPSILADFRFCFHSVLAPKELLWCTYEASLEGTFSHIQWQATVKKPSALQFPSFQIVFLVFMEREKSCQFSWEDSICWREINAPFSQVESSSLKWSSDYFFVGGPFWRPTLEVFNPYSSGQTCLDPKLTLKLKVLRRVWENSIRRTSKKRLNWTFILLLHSVNSLVKIDTFSSVKAVDLVGDK